MRTIFNAVVFCMALCVATAAQAEVVEANITGHGEGLTRQDAVQTALIDAIAQAFGVSLEATTASLNVAQQTTTQTGEETLFLAQFNKQVVQHVKTPTQSPILGYRVLNAGEVRQGAWEATVRMTYAKYKALGAPSDRRNVVVVSPEKHFKSMLTGRVSDALVSSRRFDILNRENDLLFEQEKTFITSGDAASPEVARLGQALGADYLVITELQNLAITDNERETIRLSGEVLVNSYASGEVTLKVVEFSSRKLKWSGSQKFSATYKDVTAVSEQALSDQVARSAKTLVDKMVAAIYPIQVVKVISKNTAAVSRGEGSVKVGDWFTVFLMGEEMRDPQSGESLGVLEIEVGKGKITSVTPKYSVIKVEGDVLEPRAAYILRARVR